MQIDLKYDHNGLIPAIVQDRNGQVLMLAYMNAEAVAKTLATGTTWFYSRSRQQLWHKGETSGCIQKVLKITADCDYDALLIIVDQAGTGACHEGDYSCFHHTVFNSGDPEPVTNPHILDQIYDIIVQRREHPQAGSYTNYLFDHGIDKILKKVGEESAEVIIAAKNPDNGELIYETSDLLYHLMVLLVEKGVTWPEIWRELASRRK